MRPPLLNFKYKKALEALTRGGGRLLSGSYPGIKLKQERLFPVAYKDARARGEKKPRLRHLNCLCDRSYAGVPRYCARGFIRSNDAEYRGFVQDSGRCSINIIKKECLFCINA